MEGGGAAGPVREAGPRRPPDVSRTRASSITRLQAMERRHAGVDFDELRRRVLAAEPGAWTTFVERYSALVYTLGLRLSATLPDRQEAAHAIYLAAFDRLAADGHRLLREFRGESRFETYLFALVRNEVGHQRRRLARDRRRESVLPEEAASPGADGGEGGFAEAVGLEPERVASIVAGALGRLDPAERLALRLRFRDGVALRRLAEIFGWKDTNAAHYAIIRILRKLDALGRCREALRWGEPEREMVLNQLRRMLGTGETEAGEGAAS